MSSYASTRSRLPASHRALWAAANINADTAALCSLLYWTFLYDGSRGLDVDNISGHVLICLVNAVDIFVSQRCSGVNIPFGQSSAKLPVIRSSGHQVNRSSSHPVICSSRHPMI